MTTATLPPALLPYKGKIKIALCLAIIVFSLLLLIFSGILVSRSTAFDFGYFYGTGETWNRGSDIYTLITNLSVPIYFYYLPQTAVFFGGFAHFPAETAHTLILFLNFILLVACGGFLLQIISWFRKIGVVEITLVIALLSTGFSRTNFGNSQLGIIVCFFILLMFILINKYNRQGLAGASLALLSLKYQFLPFYLIYYLYKRYWRLLIVCFLVGLVLTLAPLILTHRPLGDTFLNWVHALTQRNLVNGKIDSPVPSPSMASALMVNLEPLVYEIFRTASPIATLTFWIVFLALCGYSAYIIWRADKLGLDDILLDFSIVSVLSILSVYHRSYDTFLLFPGIIYVYLHSEKKKLGWLVFAVLMVVMLMLPGDITIRIAAHFWDILESSYIWRVLAHFQAWGSIALLLGLLWLKTQEIRQGKTWVAMKPQAGEPQTDAYSRTPSTIHTSE